MSDKYNGWANYETWCVNLWLENDQGSYQYCRERAADSLERAEGDSKDATRSFGEELKDYHEAIALSDELGEPALREEFHSSVFADLLGAALRSVDWYEIAEHWIEAAIEDQG